MYKPPIQGRKSSRHLLFTYCVVYCGALIIGCDAGVLSTQLAIINFLGTYFPSETYQIIAQWQKKTFDSWCSEIGPQLHCLVYIALFGQIVGAALGSIFCRRCGRKLAFILAGGLHLLGLSQLVSAVGLPQIIVGRFITGMGHGFYYMVVPIFLVELSPPHWRGAYTAMAAFCQNLGGYFGRSVAATWPKDFIFTIQIIFPLIGAFGGLLILDTPNSLIERGYDEQGLDVLKLIRGDSDYDNEYKIMKTSAERGQFIQSTWKELFKRYNAPQTVCIITYHILLGLVGNELLSNFNPFISQTYKTGPNNQQQLAINGVVPIAACLLSVFVVDRIGRRCVILCGTMMMAITYLVMGFMRGFVKNATKLDSYTAANYINTAGFQAGIMLLKWLVTAEVCTLETRAVGVGLGCIVHAFVKVILSLIYFKMICGLKWGIYIFNAFWALVAFIFAYFLFIETRDIPIEDVHRSYQNHWFWKQFNPPKYIEVLNISRENFE